MSTDLPEPVAWKWWRVGTGSFGIYYDDPGKWFDMGDEAYQWTLLYTADQLRAAIAAERDALRAAAEQARAAMHRVVVMCMVGMPEYDARDIQDVAQNALRALDDALGPNEK